MTSSGVALARSGQTAPSARVGRTRWSYLLLSLFLATIALIGVVWRPLVEEYLGSFDPAVPWWLQVDWLLIGVFLAMSVLIMWRADVRRDLPLIGVGFVGGLVIESWGTQTSLWTYYTLERPPLWILPAWPVATLAIDRLTGMLRPVFERLPASSCRWLYAGIVGGFGVLMVAFVWPTRGLSLTLAALVLCGFLIATPRQLPLTLATFAAGAGLGYFLERWGTTRACWTYYTLQTPPLFAVLAHGMAAVAFWRAASAFKAVAADLARRIGRKNSRTSSICAEATPPVRPGDLRFGYGRTSKLLTCQTTSSS